MSPQRTCPDAWVERFEQRNGRRPSILHIGNIANNAYLNASILNAVGIDCDVLCYDYYHVMACPEWESAIFNPNGIDQFRPRWSEVDLHGFERPRWFAQGPLNACLDYLIARRSEDETEKAWERLNRERDDPPDVNKLVLDPSRPDIEPNPERLSLAFQSDFPLRSDQLSREELVTSLTFSGLYYGRLRYLLSLYDIVVGYATDGIIPLSVGKRPYFAYEHGTIRTLPFEATPAGRLCALAYSRADVTFITNCDTVVAAEKLNLVDYRFMPHPINENVPTEPQADDLRRQLCERLEADFIAFHPARQHWDAERNPNWEKGNDIFLEGFARFVKTTRPRAAAVLIDWGNKVEQSKELIARLGIADRIAWVPPQNAVGMAVYIKASDVLADQFFLGAWGSTMPRALYFGTPAMLYVNEAIHRWCFPEMPPVVNTQSSEEVYTGLCRLLDERYANDLRGRGRAWYDVYHSNRVIAQGFISAMGDVLAPGEGKRTYDLARGLRDSQLAALTIGQDLRSGQVAAIRAFQEGHAELMQGQAALTQGQSELMLVYQEHQNAQEERLRENVEKFRDSLVAINHKLENTTRQVGLALRDLE